MVPVNNFSVMSGQVFLGWTSTRQRIKCLAHGRNTVTLPAVRSFDPQSNALPTETLRSKGLPIIMGSFFTLYYFLISRQSRCYFIGVIYSTKHEQKRILTHPTLLSNGPQCGKNDLRGFRPGHTQTSFLSYRNYLDNWNFTSSKSEYDTFQ